MIAVGPATTRRGDPLALLSRDVAWTGVNEILVRPPMVPLDSLGAGLLRDLEGVPTDAVSQSDLAFHALREYVPGDDLRHVHWRSSAKAMAAAGESQLLVRQYLDTRRSHATIVVDDAPSRVWADGEDFETAMSVAASILVRAVLDDFETSFVCGSSLLRLRRQPRPRRRLPRRARPGRAGGRGPPRGRGSPDTSLLFLVSGAPATSRPSGAPSASFPPEVRRFAIWSTPAAPSRVAEAAGLPCCGWPPRTTSPACCAGLSAR